MGQATGTPGPCAASRQACIACAAHPCCVPMGQPGGRARNIARGRDGQGTCSCVRGRGSLQQASTPLQLVTSGQREPAASQPHLQRVRSGVTAVQGLASEQEVKEHVTAEMAKACSSCRRSRCRCCRRRCRCHRRRLRTHPPAPAHLPCSCPPGCCWSRASSSALARPCTWWPAAPSPRLPSQSQTRPAPSAREPTLEVGSRACKW
jgi:hypothetical protein